MPGSAVPILLSGDCSGKLNDLFKRVTAANKKAGPFKALFSVGGFFAPSDVAGDSSSGSCELLECLEEGKDAPVSTYFIGAYGAASKKAMAALGSSSGNIHYLGRSGVTQVAGLTVAFLDGTYNEVAYSADDTGDPETCRYFTELDVAKLKLAADGAGDIDLFLTCQWPASILKNVPSSAYPNRIPPGGHPKNCSRILDELAGVLRPRYIVSGGEGIHFARAPYQNPDRGVGGHVTRFLSLGAVSNPAKEKFLHALQLVPMAMMDLDAALAKPADTTPYPFADGSGHKPAPKRCAEEPSDGQSWRWQQPGKKQRPMGKPIPGRPGVIRNPAATIFARNLPFAATEDDLEAFFARAGEIVDIRRPGDDKGRPVGHCWIQYGNQESAEAALQLHEQLLMGRPITIEMSNSRSSSGPMQPTGKPVDKCWFCLSNESAAVWLIVSVGQEAYLTLDKSPMHPLHCLAIPIEHYPSAVSLSPSGRRDMTAYKDAVQKFYQSQGYELVGFERHMQLRRMGGNHCHLNMLPISKTAAAGARDEFERAARQDGFSLQHLESDRLDKLEELVGANEYFVAYLPDGSMLWTEISRDKKHPMDFGRRVIASLLGTPEKAHPKECALSQSEEEDLAEKFKASFNEFDIMG